MAPTGTEPTDIAHRVIDDNHFMVLGTSQPDGTPRVSPVFYNHAGYRDFYWISSVRSGVRPYGVDELSGDAELRLYRATVHSVEIHVRGSDPERGTGIDRRLAVEM
jgi:hypothetical protein